MNHSMALAWLFLLLAHWSSKLKVLLTLVVTGKIAEPVLFSMPGPSPMLVLQVVQVQGHDLTGAGGP